MTPSPHNMVSISSEDEMEKGKSNCLDQETNKSNTSSEDAGLEETESKRPAWDNKVQYLMAALGFAVGLGNIWRFPYLCKKNGGGAFLIPYVIMLFVEGYPLYYLELAVGQKIRKGTIGVWMHINPYLGGVGVASNVISCLIGLYYNMILGWALFYFFNSFQTTLPWSSCPLINNSTPVHECLNSSATSYFWYRETLDISYTIEDGGQLNWRMVLALFVAWVLVFIGMNKGIKSSGKVMYFATSFPYVVLIAFFFRGITLDGALEGIEYMFSPDLKRLSDADVWREAATQIFFSLGLGYGSIIAYSSYNKPKNDCRKDALFIATANCLTSIFACVTVFSVLGFKAKTTTLQCFERNKLAIFEEFPQFTSSKFEEKSYKYIIDEVRKKVDNNASTFLSTLPNCSMAKELDSDVQGTGLAFIAFTEAINNFPGGPFWSVLFFFMLLNIEMSSEFGILQTVVTTVLDSGVKISKTVLTACLCSVLFIIGLVFTQRSGSYFLDIFDSYSATLSLVTIAFFEVISVSYIYGIKRFEDDLEKMVGIRPGYYWTISWRFTCPAALLVILGASIAGLVMKVPTYQGWNPNTGSKDTLPFPPWALALIVILVLISVLCIPLMALLYYKGIVKPEHFGGAVLDKSKTTSGDYEIVTTESRQPLALNPL